MPKLPSSLSPFRQHANKWQNCTLCNLCEGRRNVVLARGKLPCDVLFIGEAPGASEDILGVPFIGPAGKLLDRMIFEAERMRGLDPPPSKAFTNLLACIPPQDAKGRREPKMENIRACAPRLLEMVFLSQPKLIVAVGTIARDKMPDVDLLPVGPKTVDIIHPSALLQMDVSKRDVTTQMAIINLADALEDVWTTTRS